MSPPAGPEVSVCIPAFDGEAFIGQAIASVLAQSFADFELVVVDDASLDRTTDVVLGFSDPRLRLVRNERRLGPEGNWNRALAAASGRYLKILPQDDFLHPACLEKERAALERGEFSSAALVCAGRAFIDERGRGLFGRSFPGKGGLVAARAAVRACVRAGTNLIGEPAAVLLRAEVVRQVGPFDGRLPYLIDLDYWFRALRRGDLAVLKERLCGFRLSRRAVSTRVAASQSREFRAFIRRLAAEGAFALSPSDVRRGEAMAVLNGRLRRFLYAVLFRRRPGSPPQSATGWTTK
ncbi:MAG: glycosyltransferase [Candidatus Aminicenantes bacterium]|nr:glycosyltransferase [Candidatus Aminicenantes bacterium]